MHRRSRAFARLLPVAIASAMLLTVPRIASAQVNLAGFLGAELDNKENWLLFGGEARFSMKSVFNGSPWDGSARLSYHSYGSGASTTQIDFNLLTTPELAHPGKLTPYMGAGIALLRSSFEGATTTTTETKVGLNLVSGVRLRSDSSSPVEPFLNAQYSIVPDYPNSFTVAAGLSFRLSSGKR